MHHHILEDATLEQLKTFISDSFDRLKETMPELYSEMECELYEHVYGEHFTKWKYEKAVAELVNQDGSKGAHWTYQQIIDYAKSKDLAFQKFNTYDFAYVMNIMFSDYHGVVGDGTDMYFKLAKAFLEDVDAPEGKAFRYYKAMR